MNAFRRLLAALFSGSLGLCFIVGCSHTTANVKEPSFQQDMDAYCTAKLNTTELSKLSADDKKGVTYSVFFSRKLHTCVESFVAQDPKNASAMTYILSDLTRDFTPAPKWHPIELPLHVIQGNYGNDHYLYVQGYWASVSSKQGEQSASEANSVTLNCDYGDKSLGDQANSCTEIEGYIQSNSLHSDTQTYHIASWSPDEVIATDSERGFAGGTTTTMIIHPQTNEIEIFDTTKMNEKQPDLMKGLEGKSYRDHYEFHGGMYALSASAVLFQCDEEGVITDMRLDVAQKYDGDVYDVPNAEWNAGSKSSSKYTAEQCEDAMEKKRKELN
jgi:hypothetical protein